ncbi:MAG: hypothetical protein M8357_02795 [Desulfobulbaceae bacterium]|nr:hypothetical protein [Desulfobulbaceae bacterium]
MKKGMKVLGGITLALALTLVFSASGFAATFKCGAMQPALINATSVQLVNRTGAACGPLPAGTMQLFQLDANKNDQLLAILLTAASLQKTVWVYSPTDNMDNKDIVTAVALDGR